MLQSAIGDISTRSRHGDRPGPRARIAAAVSCLAATGLALAACGTTTAPTPHPTSAVGATCQVVSAVLSDGPDPSADPVGYALAQIGPLRSVKTSDSALRGDITALASAYQSYYSSNGSSSAQHAVNSAGKRLDSVCPGAF